MYLSTENLSLPKGCASKLSPKFTGLYWIIEDYRNNSFKLDLPSELKQHGLHPAFHANLLQAHVPNDDCKFPRHQLNQIASLGNSEEWAVQEIKTHQGKGRDALFKLVWKTGDHAWMPYHKISHLEVVNQYLEAVGASSIDTLLKQLSKADDLPLNSIKTRLDNFACEIVANVELMHQQRRIPKNGTNHRCEKDKRTAHAIHECPSSHHHKMNVPANPPPYSVPIAPPVPATPVAPANNTAIFNQFAQLIRNGTYDLCMHHIPCGYVTYAERVQGTSLAVPFPLSIPVCTKYVNGIAHQIVDGHSQ